MLARRARFRHAALHGRYLLEVREIEARSASVKLLYISMAWAGGFPVRGPDAPGSAAAPARVSTNVSGLSQEQRSGTALENKPRRSEGTLIPSQVGSIKVGDMPRGFGSGAAVGDARRPRQPWSSLVVRSRHSRRDNAAVYSAPRDTSYREP